MPIDPSVQPTYQVNTPPIVAPRTQGQVISLMNINQMRYMAFEPFAGVELPCGVPVTGSTDTMGKTIVTQPSNANALLLGVSIWNQQRLLSFDSALNCYKYAFDDMVSIIEEGDIVMFSEVSVDVGQPVYYRHTADAALNRLGALSNEAGTGLELIPKARFIEKAMGGLVRVHVDF